jgi:hypothetical protein
MLATIHIHGFGPYVCGRIPSKRAQDVPRFSSAPRLLASLGVTDVNSIREAAKSMHPIYASIGNMLGNDKYGNCTAVAGQKIQAIFDCAAGRQWRMPTLADALWTYSQTTNPPFNPATGANDGGAELETVLSFWQSHGLFQDGYGKIKAAQAVDATNKAEVIAALEANGVLYAGCLLPAAIENIRGTGFMWPMLGPPVPTLGHCTLIYGHNDIGVFVSTWGMEGTITWEAFAYYFGGKTGEIYTVVAV